MTLYSCWFIYIFYCINLFYLWLLRSNRVTHLRSLMNHSSHFDLSLSVKDQAIIQIKYKVFLVKFRSWILHVKSLEVESYPNRDSQAETTLKTHARVENVNYSCWNAGCLMCTSLRVKHSRGTHNIMIFTSRILWAMKKKCCCL